MHILITKLWVPSAIEVIHLETPLLLRFELIDHYLQVATIDTVLREELHHLEGRLIIVDLGGELISADEVRIGHVPLLGRYRIDQRQQQPHPNIHFIIVIES